MKITFTGDPRAARNATFEANDPDRISMYGIQFKKDVAVDVPDDSEYAKRYGPKFAANSHFTVDTGPAPDDPVPSVSDMPTEGVTEAAADGQD